MHDFLLRPSLSLLLLICLLLAGCGNPGPPVLKGESIVCFGDSLTFGTGAPRDRSYPAQLAEMIGRQVINSGIPGDTTARALQRVQRDVLAKSPRIVLITLGGNDLKNGVDKKTAFQNLKEIVETIQSRNVLVVIGGIKVPFWDRGYDKEYKNLAQETGALLIPDILGGIMGNRELMHDTIHPNSAGYRIMARKFYTVIEPYL